jgi:hypothetical protein
MAEKNPNPATIPDPIWRLWTDRPNKAWQLGGIYANKKYYHNTVRANQENWPGNYSIELDLDLKHGNLDFARAIDLSMSTLEMKKWTANMQRSALDDNDPRLDAVREFYGTLNGVTVYGLIKDTVSGKWHKSSSNLSHLWHGHVSIFTAFVNDWDMLEPLLSVWAGETLEEWSDGVSLPKLNDSGEEVRMFQYIHNLARTQFKSPAPELKTDGDYGKATVEAFTVFAKQNGASETYVATSVTGWLATKYLMALITRISPPDAVTPPPVKIPDDVLRAMVNDWLHANIPAELKVIGKIEL